MSVLVVACLRSAQPTASAEPQGCADDMGSRRANSPAAVSAPANPAPTNIDTTLRSAPSRGSSAARGASSTVTTQSSHLWPRTGHVLQSTIITGPPDPCLLY